MAKKNFQEEMAKAMEQVKVNWQKISKEAGELAKKGEKELSKAAKVGGIQLEILGLNLKMDKLRYEIGKKIVEKRGDKVDMEDSVRTLIDEVAQVESEIERLKKEVSKIDKKGKTKQ